MPYRYLLLIFLNVGVVPCGLHAMKRSGAKSSLKKRYSSKDYNVVELLLQLPVTGDTAKSLQESKTLFEGYLKRFKKGPVISTAHFRMGDVYQVADKLPFSTSKLTYFPGDNRAKAHKHYMLGYEHDDALQRIKAFCALQLGYIYLMNQKYEEAQPLCECAKNILKGDLKASALNALGISLYKQNKTKKAVACWQYVIKTCTSPDKARAHQNLSWACEDTCNYQAALDHLKKAKEHGHKFDAIEYKQRVEILRNSIEDTKKK